MTVYRTPCRVEVSDLDPEALDPQQLRARIVTLSAEQGRPCPIPDECADHAWWVLQRGDVA